MTDIEVLVEQFKGIIEEIRAISPFKNIRTAKTFPEIDDKKYIFRIWYDREIKEGLTTSCTEIIYKEGDYKILKENYIKVNGGEVLNRINDVLSK